MVFSDSCLLSEGALTGVLFYSEWDFTTLSVSCGDLSLATKGCFFLWRKEPVLKAFRRWGN
jgi:hypothetical protein